MMPKLDGGLGLVAALRADLRTAAIPVLLLRASRSGGLHRGLRAGADDYLVKPFAAADLLARVRRTSNWPGCAHPPRPVAHRVGRLAAGGVLRPDDLGA